MDEDLERKISQKIKHEYLVQRSQVYGYKYSYCEDIHHNSMDRVRTTDQYERFRTNIQLL